jgi:hypothetical protein
VSGLRRVRAAMRELAAIDAVEGRLHRSGRELNDALDYLRRRYAPGERRDALVPALNAYAATYRRTARDPGAGYFTARGAVIDCDLCTRPGLRAGTADGLDHVLGIAHLLAVESAERRGTTDPAR